MIVMALAPTVAFLFISHDIAVVERVSHRVAVMYAGEIIETGPTEAVLNNPQHSYTRRLLAAVPRPDPERHARKPVALEAILPQLVTRQTRGRGLCRSPSAPGHFVRTEAA